MLTHICIRDFAIVDLLELDLGPGLTVLTGETGTGKSILIDALGLALGDRADTGIIRHGSTRAEISAIFDLSRNQAALSWLREHDLDSDDECQLRRTISSDGKSKAFVNGRTLPVQMLRELGNLLVDIHGQHEHQSLLRKDIQRKLLDEYAGHQRLLSDVAAAYQSWKSLKQEYEDLHESVFTRNNDQLELLRYQVQELQALNVTVAEINSLEEDQRRLANADKLIDTSNHALEVLDENEQSVDAVLSRIIGDMQQLLQSDRQLSSVIDLLQSASIQIREAATELRYLLDHLDLDPQLLNSIEQRLGVIHDLARKHRIRPEELPGLNESLIQRLSALEDAEENLEKLRDRIETASNHYLAAADKLSESRKASAGKLARQVTSNMKKLGMPGSSLNVRFEEVTDAFSAYGKDRVEFLVSTSPNQPEISLNKIVSGGELSRISLAIQVITAHQADIPTLIFDEVDVGIGGRVAEIVGQKLRTLGNSHQILCVTHLPQVATLGHHHIQVTKSVSAKTTQTLIQHLTGEARNEEIARMLGGIEITAQTRAHAKEMIDRAQTSH